MESTELWIDEPTEQTTLQYSSIGNLYNTPIRGDGRTTLPPDIMGTTSSTYLCRNSLKDKDRTFTACADDYSITLITQITHD
jgi:hypothetical protein